MEVAPPPAHRKTGRRRLRGGAGGISRWPGWAAPRPRPCVSARRPVCSNPARARAAVAAGPGRSKSLVGPGQRPARAPGCRCAARGGQRVGGRGPGVVLGQPGGPEVSAPTAVTRLRGGHGAGWAAPRWRSSPGLRPAEDRQAAPQQGCRPRRPSARVGGYSGPALPPGGWSAWGYTPARGRSPVGPGRRPARAPGCRCAARGGRRSVAGLGLPQGNPAAPRSAPRPPWNGFGAGPRGCGPCGVARGRLPGAVPPPGCRCAAAGRCGLRARARRGALGGPPGLPWARPPAPWGHAPGQGPGVGVSGLESVSVLKTLKPRRR